MLAKLGFGSSSKEPKNIPVQVDYTSNPVVIPPDFLASPPAQPITSRPVAFAASSLPEYESKTALVLDNVLSSAECDQFLALAADSVPREDGASAWRPALIALAPGWEAPAPGYRESDRIVWDEQDVVDRLWGRCMQAEGLGAMLGTVPFKERGLEGANDRWELRGLNKRMRFLKYTRGQFFKPHCDSPTYVDGEESRLQTHYTLHLFLNDSAAESSSGQGVVGGATAFLSRDRKRRLDVNLRAGSVLIFQQSGLLHEGALVKKGEKYTMRTDIFYELVLDPKDSSGPW